MKIVAHRGASHERPENTLPAYELAAAQGAEGWECDVRLTADGHVVCHHDRDIDRTSNSRGPVSSYTLNELRQLDFGTPAHPASILTLRELLELFQDTRHSQTPSGPHTPPQHSPQASHPSALDLFIETKTPDRNGRGIEAAVHHILQQMHLTTSPNIHLISFSSRSLRRCRRLAPQLHRILLHRDYELHANHTLGKLRARIAHDRGLPIQLTQTRPAALPTPPNHTYMWTADEPAEVQWAVDHGISWLATNRPAAAIQWRDTHQAQREM